MIRWRWPLATLRRRLAMLTSTAVGLAVLVTGLGTYLGTRYSLYDQLDQELVQIAAYETTPIGEDLENMGGLNYDALRAANVTLLVLSADNTPQRVPGERVTLQLSADELVVAKLQTGYSARSGTATNGDAYRIVAVPLKLPSGTVKQRAYALVLGRPLAPTQNILNQLGLLLLFFGGMMAVVAGLAGFFVARQGLRPLRRLAAAVANVTETDQLTPMATEGNDEVTELARAFNTLLYSVDSSRERQRRLIADAGHELRTPLTSLRTNIELLVADEKSGMLPRGARAEILRDVASQLSEFTSLIGDLVQLARDEQIKAAPEPIDLRSVVQNAVTRAKRRGPGLAFDVTLAPHYLVGEPDQLERAITNLLDNAVKFSPSGGTVTVRMDAETLVVADQGPGIAEADLPHIWDRFYRSDKARNTPGTGLGLSIVSHTVNAHGGWIQAGRATGGGAEFTMWLPGGETPPGADE